MNNQNRNLGRRLLGGALALATAGALAACTPAEQSKPAAVASSTPAPQFFGPNGYRKLTVTMTESQALATGDLQPAPVSTVLGVNVYSYQNGPKPDPRRMAADEELEKQVAAANKNTSDQSAEEHARDAQSFARSTQRIIDRLEAFLTAGGASFRGGKIDAIAAPEGATTEAGIKRGSTVAELKAAYQGKSLKSTSKASYEVPMGGQAGWVLRFEIDKDAVRFMSMSPQA